MALPEIKIPEIVLPFDIPTLLHPAVVHFVVAIPVVILLLEIYNLFTKRRSIGAFSFILLLITIGMLSVSYLTGLHDGKEAYDLLTSGGQEELKAHKLLGVYVLFASVGVLVFKLLAMTGKGFFRFLYLLMLIGLIAITLKQGKEGGELVYEYGANVERVVSVGDDLSDLKEGLEACEEDKEKHKVEAPKVEVSKPAPVVVEKEVEKAPVTVPATVVEATPEVPVVQTPHEVIGEKEKVDEKAKVEEKIQKSIVDINETL